MAKPDLMGDGPSLETNIMAYIAHPAGLELAVKDTVEVIEVNASDDSQPSTDDAAEVPHQEL